MRTTMKTNKTEIILFTLFAVIGNIFLLAGIVTACLSVRFYTGAVSLEGRITSIETYREQNEQAYVSYAYENQEYKNIALGGVSSNMYEGEKITLYIDPQNPKNVKSKLDFWLPPVIFLGFGILFSLIGWIPLLRKRRKKRKNQWLRENGSVLYGVVERSDWNASYTVNGRHPFVIFCTYTDELSGTIYRFKSDNLWFDPDEHFPPGTPIKIYVKREDYSSYFVDVESRYTEKIVDFT